MRLMLLSLCAILAFACKPLRTSPESSVLESGLPEGYEVSQIRETEIAEARRLAVEQDRFWPEENYKKALAELTGNGKVPTESTGVKVTYKGQMVGYFIFYVGENHIGIQDLVLAKGVDANKVMSAMDRFIDTSLREGFTQSKILFAKFDAGFINHAERMGELGFRKVVSETVIDPQTGAPTGDTIMSRELEVLSELEREQHLQEFKEQEERKKLSSRRAKFIVSPKMRALFESNFESLRDSFDRKKPLKVNDKGLTDAILQGAASKNIGGTVVLGGAGSGKTTAAISIMHDIVEGKYASVIPQDSVIVMTDATKLMSDTSFVGQSGEKPEALKRMVKYEASRGRKVILLIDEIHSLANVGKNEGSSVDFLNALKTELASGDLIVIGTSTPDEWREYLRKTEAMERRFAEYRMPELSEREIFERLRNWVVQNDVKERLWREGQGVPSPAERELYELVKRFQPNKAILNAMVDVVDKIQANNEVQRRVYNENPPTEITPDLLKEHVTRILQLNPADLGSSPDIEKKLARFDKAMQKYQGLDKQAKALRRLTETSYAPRATSKKEPLMISHSDGSPGTGKTDSLLELGRAMEWQTTKINMSDYGPSGKTATEFRSELLQAVQNKSNPFIILDELEKARADIIKVLYSVYAEGEITGEIELDGSKKTRKISFSNARIASTGNILENMINQKLAAGETLKLSDARSELESFFGILEGKEKSTAFPSRIGKGIIPFFPGNYEMFVGIIDRGFERFVAEIAAAPNGHRLQYTAEQKTAVIEKFTQEFYGDKDAKRWTSGFTPREVSNALHTVIQVAAMKQSQDSTFEVPSALSYACESEDDEW